MARPSKILVILLNWNGKKDTLECLASLDQVTYRHFHTIVVDNGSTDDSIPRIRAQFPHVPILETKQNLGFAGGNNVGIAWGLQKPYQWFLLLNNDTKVAPDFLDGFMMALKKRPQAKILGGKIYRYDTPQVIDHLGGIWRPTQAEFESLGHNALDQGQYEEMQQVDYVCGACLLMHRTVPETIGLLEPRYFLFWEETDFCIRAKRSGFEIWTAPQAKIWHKISSSFVGGKPHMHYFWWRSRLLWIERNCLFKERKILYQKVIFPELFKQARHYLLLSLQGLFSRSEEKRKKKLRLKAGLFGALHYILGRFGNCPKWLRQKKS